MNTIFNKIAAIAATVLFATTLVACHVIVDFFKDEKRGGIRRLESNLIADEQQPRSSMRQLTSIGELKIDCDSSIDTTKNYYIEARHSGKILEPGAGPPPSYQPKPVAQNYFIDSIYSFNKWQLSASSDEPVGIYHVSNTWSYVPLPANRLYDDLNVAGGSSDDLAEIVLVQRTSSSNAPTEWCFQPAGDEYYYMIALHSGKVMDVKGSSLEDGAELIQWEKKMDGAENQQFKLVEAREPTPRPTRSPVASPSECDSSCASQEEYEDLFSSVKLLTTELSALRDRVGTLEGGSTTDCSSSVNALLTLSDSDLVDMTLNDIDLRLGDCCRISQRTTTACNFYVKACASPTGYAGWPRTMNDQGTGCSSTPDLSSDTFCYYMSSEYDNWPLADREAMCTNSGTANMAAQLRHAIQNGACCM